MTSVHLEDAFWVALKEIAAAQGTPVGRLVATIDSERQHANLSSAVRLFVLDYYRQQKWGRYRNVMSIEQGIRCLDSPPKGAFTAMGIELA
jgi:predicted DNA-binding ribbon-helix-helix protein